MSNVPKIIRDIAEYKTNEENRFKDDYDAAKNDEEQSRKSEFERKIKQLRQKDFLNNVTISFIGISGFYFVSFLIPVIFGWLSGAVTEHSLNEFKNVFYLMGLLLSLFFVISIPICFLKTFLKKTNQLFEEKVIKIPAETARYDERLLDRYVKSYLYYERVRNDYSSLISGELVLVKKPRATFSIDNLSKKISIYYKSFEDTDTCKKGKKFITENEDEFIFLLDYLRNYHSSDYTDFLMRAVDEEAEKLKCNKEKG